MDGRREATVTQEAKPRRRVRALLFLAVDTEADLMFLEDQKITLPRKCRAGFGQACDKVAEGTRESGSSVVLCSLEVPHLPPNCRPGHDPSHPRRSLASGPDPLRAG